MGHRRLFKCFVTAFAVLASVVLGSATAIGSSQDLGISLTSTIDGTSAEAPGLELREGLPITLVFTATNTGTEPLSGLGLTDDVLGPIDCPAVMLEPRHSVICEVSIEAIGGKHRSTSVVSAATPDGRVVDASLLIGYKGLRLEWVAAVDIDVLVNGSSSRWPGPTLVPGEQAVFTYRVLNEGTVPLERIKVLDPQGLRVICPTKIVEAGGTVECTATGTVIEGRFKELAVVRAWDSRGTRVQGRQRIHYLGEQPTLRAQFSASTMADWSPAAAAPGPMVEADRWISWSVEVTNTGEDDLWALYARDLDEGGMKCEESHLAPGASTNCMVRGRAVAGPMVGEIEISAWASDGRQITETYPRHAFGLRPGPDLLIETFVDGFDADQHAGPRRVVGETLDFTYVVHNVGTLDLRQVKVEDSLFGAVVCPSRFVRSGDTMVCSHSVTAELGWWETAGTAKGRGGTELVRDSDKTFWHVKTVERVSRIDLRVTIDGLDADSRPWPRLVAGETVEIVYRATNAGNSPLWSLEIRDPNVPFSAMACWGSRDPLPGIALMCRATIVVGEGKRWEEIEAVAWNSDGTRIVGEDSICYVGVIGPT